MAAAVLPSSAAAKPSRTPIIVEPQIEPVKGDFSPSRHIAFIPPSKIYSMKELGFPEDKGISPVAVSEPFQLFTQEAVMRMRQEVLSPEVLSNFQYSSNLSQCQLRGFASKCAPFVYDAWKSPETLAIVSKIAGIDLVPEMDFEIAHVNISVKSAKEKKQEMGTLNERASYRADEGIAGRPWENDDRPIVDWHTDSYPFVCITMLSDCSTMIGGETALRTGYGEIMKVRGLQMRKGCAVVLQGRHIEHQALRALGTTERITMVTSFRPRCPRVRDDTVLTTVRPVSDLRELYRQFAEYRLEILEERVRRQLRELRDAHAAGGRVPTCRLRAFFAEQERFLAHMNREMVDDGEVVMGSIDDSHLLTRSGANTDGAKVNKRARVV
ncbi:hypothetical protein DL769_002893 [Monosporascus sp. CRB-8-3]|nr:hypothetical protein DL769_002893 [Monosporascus sp. CRB-8-3]